MYTYIYTYIYIYVYTQIIYIYIYMYTYKYEYVDMYSRAKIETASEGLQQRESNREAATDCNTGTVTEKLVQRDCNS